MDELITKLQRLLVQGDIMTAIELLRPWLSCAKRGAPDKLLRACSPSVRPKIALLMQDLLSRYPATLIGAPLLIHIAPDDESVEKNKCVCLPAPRVNLAQPSSDLLFLGWLTTTTQLPVHLPFKQELHPIEVRYNHIYSVIALFRSHPEVFDIDQLELPPTWWGELFRPIEGNINITSDLLLPYPAAIEAAQVLLQSAKGATLDNSSKMFLTDSAWGWAYNKGVLFFESCRTQYPHVI